MHDREPLVGHPLEPQRFDGYAPFRQDGQRFRRAVAPVGAVRGDDEEEAEALGGAPQQPPRLQPPPAAAAGAFGFRVCTFRVQGTLSYSSTA